MISTAPQATLNVKQYSFSLGFNTFLGCLFAAHKYYSYDQASNSKDSNNSETSNYSRMHTSGRTGRGCCRQKKYNDMQCTSYLLVIPQLKSTTNKHPTTTTKVTTNDDDIEISTIFVIELPCTATTPLPQTSPALSPFSPSL